MPINGLVVMTPTSIASTGTGNSSSIGAKGKVTFTSCESLSLNGVFTSTYDNYIISLRLGVSASTQDIRFRLRVSGTDASGSNYVSQLITAQSTTVLSSRSSTSTFASVFGTYATTQSGSTIYVFGPALSQPTAGRSVNVSDQGSAAIREWAFTHSVSTAYDGFTLSGLQTQSGAITVYGFNQ